MAGWGMGCEMCVLRAGREGGAGGAAVEAEHSTHSIEEPGLEQREGKKKWALGRMQWVKGYWGGVWGLKESGAEMGRRGLEVW